jgi:hypothetical protein
MLLRLVELEQKRSKYIQTLQSVSPHSKSLKRLSKKNQFERTYIVYKFCNPSGFHVKDCEASLNKYGKRNIYYTEFF